MTSTVDTDSFEAAWGDWHTERERYYSDPLGWVSLTGLYWLTDEFDTIGDLPGRWRADADGVYIEGFGANTTVEPIEGAPGILVEDGDRRIEVIRRTGSVALRVHDPKSPHLASFTGIPAYAPSEQWSVTGTFTPFEESKIVTTGAVVEGLEHHHTAVGVIDFELGGEAQQFVAFGRSVARGTTGSGGLQILFTDATSGVTTYPAARSLAVDDPADDGSVVLDFNRASNLPCSFTDYATCPVAPAENKLPVAVEAGEKNPRPILDPGDVEVTRVPLSVLDLSPISEGSTAAQALRNTIDLAQQTEEWGYERYWVAEHHFVAAASSSPAVLIGLIAAATDRIRVGSAAVQIGHHTAASVVESFGIVDAVYPGRIDLGIGRSGQRAAEALAGKRTPTAAREDSIVEGILFPKPFDASQLVLSELLRASAEVLQQPLAQAPDFEVQLDDIVAFLHGRFTTPSGVSLTATPGAGAAVKLWLFGSSGGQSAQVAGARGLPFVANYHVSPGTTLDAVEAYRAAFVPSPIHSEPYVVVSADALVAESDSEAEYLASSFGQWVHSIRSGHGAIPYPDPKTGGPLTPEQAALVHDRVATQFVGSAATVAEKLDGLQRATGAAELVVTSVAHDHQDRLRSYELLGKEWGLPRLRV